MSERDGRSALRTLWSYGVRVTKRADGSLALTPPENVTPELRQLAIDAKPDIAAVVAELPAHGRCPVCGTNTGHPDIEQLHCTDCALIAAERRGYLVSADMDMEGAA